MFSLYNKHSEPVEPVKFRCKPRGQKTINKNFKFEIVAHLKEVLKFNNR